MTSERPEISTFTTDKLYQGTTFESIESKHFVLHQDTILAFLPDAVTRLNAWSVLESSAGVFITFSISFVSWSAEGKRLGISSEQWQGFLGALALGAMYWFLKSLWRYLKHRKASPASLTEELGKKGAVLSSVRSEPKAESKRN